MRIKYNYELDADAVVIEIDMQKSDYTIELTEHILVDVTSDMKLVGIEILDASVELSKLFNRAVSKDEMKQLLCKIKQEPNEYLVQFQSPKKNESANLLIPLYRSPLIS
ncbi:DUF2283 domain-containing protein [Candidatus Micrarchaeota archaeon]|nr:DUF2283 domain-containing protein [Candidatus Micrarchaeota archaeon]